MQANLQDWQYTMYCNVAVNVCTALGINAWDIVPVMPDFYQTEPRWHAVARELHALRVMLQHLPELPG